MSHHSRQPSSTHPDRMAAVKWARDLLAGKNFVVLDSETTGLSSVVDFVELAVVSSQGEPLIDCLLEPSCPIQAAATAVHGHTAHSLRGAPRFYEIYADLLDVMHGKRVVVYNASFDRRVWDTVVRRLGARGALAGALPGWECAMRQYAKFFGERSKGGRGYRNQKLTGGDHSALGDARATLRLIERMATG